MSRGAFDLLSGVIASVWMLFNSWYLPGTHATPGEMALFLLTAYVTLRFFKRVAKVDKGEASDKS